jgi:caa(3)-type oxidase subunit IV
MSAHAHAARTYSLILLALLGLTVITVAAAGINFGSSAVNVVIALTIASIKASLVALYFMHLRHDKPVNSVIFLSGIFFLALFLILSLVDEMSRPRIFAGNSKPPAGGLTKGMIPPGTKLPAGVTIVDPNAVVPPPLGPAPASQSATPAKP